MSGCGVTLTCSATPSTITSDSPGFTSEGTGTGVGATVGEPVGDGDGDPVGDGDGDPVGDGEGDGDVVGDGPGPGPGVGVGKVGVTVFDTGDAADAGGIPLVAVVVKVYAVPGFRPDTTHEVAGTVTVHVRAGLVPTAVTV